MRIIITTVTPEIESGIDPRFGRGAYMLIVDPDTLEWQAYPNPGASAPGGAGIRAAQFVCGQKVDVIISGDFGPNAYQALQAANVDMYLYGSNGTARQIIERFKAGQLPKVDAPTQEERDHAHSGVG